MVSGKEDADDADSGRDDTGRLLGGRPLASRVSCVRGVLIPPTSPPQQDVFTNRQTSIHQTQLPQPGEGGEEEFFDSSIRSSRS